MRSECDSEKYDTCEGLIRDLHEHILLIFGLSSKNTFHYSSHDVIQSGRFYFGAPLLIFVILHFCYSLR